MSDSKDDKGIKDDLLDEVSGGASTKPDIDIGVGHGHLSGGKGPDPDIAGGTGVSTGRGKPIPPG